MIRYLVILCTVLCTSGTVVHDSTRELANKMTKDWEPFLLGKPNKLHESFSKDVRICLLGECTTGLSVFDQFIMGWDKFKITIESGDYQENYFHINFSDSISIKGCSLEGLKGSIIGYIKNGVVVEYHEFFDTTLLNSLLSCSGIA